jgi:hypothetical protein
MQSAEAIEKKRVGVFEEAKSAKECGSSWK